MCYSIEKRHVVCAGGRVEGVWWLFQQHVIGMWWSCTAETVVAQTSHFVPASYFDRRPMKLFDMCGYTGWHWKAHDYSSSIVLYPLQVGCHIMSRTKQQWLTVVNSWQNKSRYKCGHCSTCQESTNRRQSTEYKVTCQSSIGGKCIHSKMTA